MPCRDLTHHWPIFHGHPSLSRNETSKTHLRTHRPINPGRFHEFRARRSPRRPSERWEISRNRSESGTYLVENVLARGTEHARHHGRFRRLSSRFCYTSLRRFLVSPAFSPRTSEYARPLIPLKWSAHRGAEKRRLDSAENNTSRVSRR